MHSTDSRFVTGPSNTLFSGVYVYTFQPGTFTGWGSEGVNNNVLYCNNNYNYVQLKQSLKLSEWPR